MRMPTADCRLPNEGLIPNGEALHTSLTRQRRREDRLSLGIRHSFVIRASSLVISLGLLCATNTYGADWLHWRGPEQTGVARDTGLPDKWSPDQSGENNLIWKQPIG